VIERVAFERDAGAGSEELVTREWLVTNGLGGYASGTLAGVCTRRYHGLLIAALAAPLGRTMMLNHLSEQLRLANGTVVRLGGEEAETGLVLHGIEHLAEVRLEMGLPVWRYVVSGTVVEKRLFMPHLQNTVHVIYTLVSGPGPVRIKLRPAISMREHDAPVGALGAASPYTLSARGDRYELVGRADVPALKLRAHGTNAAFTIEPRPIGPLVYRIEGSRGYESTGELWTPGYVRADLAAGSAVALVGSTEGWEVIDALEPETARSIELTRRANLIARATSPALRQGAGAELVLAADQFVITPSGRVEDAARARAEGEEVRTVIAGYHWFTDWGRDTMISLPGLTLATGRVDEARWILQSFARHLRDGLLPNLFPEGKKEGLYHTADATLWMFQALSAYVRATEDWTTVEQLLPKLEEVVERHRRGTRFGIGVDQSDGLLRQGEAGYALTWMDAKCEGWVVTPRRGKAVEINALWHNALEHLADWRERLRGESAARPLREEALRVRSAFNARFWYEPGGHLYDVVDGEQGDDAACRPNQILAVALPHSVLEAPRWRSVVDVVARDLLTPVGLRSLARSHPDYKATYHGDLRTRDAAYHQGTVWSWLIGPFVDAWMKTHPDDEGAVERLLAGLVQHLGEACVGQVSEVFDAERPFAPRGCVAQAWGVAEMIRVMAR